MGGAETPCHPYTPDVSSTRRLLATLAALSACMAFAGSVPTATALGAPAVLRDPGVPSYVVHLRTVGVGHAWTGAESVTFTNLGATGLGEIWLRLWSNGVMGCGGVGGHDAIRVFRVMGGTADAPTVNCTALRIQLDAPLPPGGRTTVGMRLAIDVPKRDDRFGYRPGLTLLGTALPTLAVRDDQGWHATEPFVDLGESFYSIAGTYRVTLSAPRGVATPATGFAVAHHDTRSGRSVTTYAASSVRDFAWAAGRLATVTGQVGATRVVVSYQRPGVTRGEALDALATARGAMRTYGRDFGAYPYREMDVVLPASASFGGMEYPQIVFTNPYAINHEVAHQWWYGVVGDDEFHEPWLDEGFATWTERLAPGGATPWRNCGTPTWPSPAARLTNDMNYWDAHRAQYGAVVYDIGGCMLADLAHRFGMATFLGVLRSYAQAHWFGVTRSSEFRDAIDAAALADGVSLPAGYWSAWRVD